MGEKLFGSPQTENDPDGEKENSNVMSFRYAAPATIISAMLFGIFHRPIINFFRRLFGCSKSSNDTSPPRIGLFGSSKRTNSETKQDNSKIIIVILLLIGGIGVYWALNHDGEGSQPPKSQHQRFHRAHKHRSDRHKRRRGSPHRDRRRSRHHRSRKSRAHSDESISDRTRRRSRKCRSNRARDR